MDESTQQDTPRLIEKAFPLKQASLDSVHEKNVRHGHISTLHIWPARRPLAACRAALIATLLPDPGTPEKRKELCEKIGGKVVKRVERKRMPGGKIVEREKEETEGGILHWGRETENSKDLDWFREEIKKAYGGRAPKVLDPFSGGGAIPLEAMRLGCEATAIDINPVAWFILKCTLEYPQKLAGKTFPLPEFILENDDFMDAFYKAHPFYKKPEKSKARLKKEGLDSVQIDNVDQLGVKECKSFRADLAWHVRAWGQWVLDNARKELAPFYPTYADFEPLEKTDSKPYERQEMRLVPIDEDGIAKIDELNKEFSREYLSDKSNPRWVAKPTVAYLWARTVTCKNCRATVPLLKTRWLCKKEKKRIILTMEPNEEKTGVVFGIQNDVTVVGGNTAQRREHDKKVGAGTMSKAGAKCPCCPAIMTMEDIKFIGKSGNVGFINTAVVIDTHSTKEYRLPSEHEALQYLMSQNALNNIYKDIPFGLPDEKITEDAKRNTWCVQFGVDKFSKLFTDRQSFALGIFLQTTRKIHSLLSKEKYPSEFVLGIFSFLTCIFDRLANQSSNASRWNQGGEKIEGTFARFALPLVWDFAECNPLGETSGGYPSAFNWVMLAASHLTSATSYTKSPTVLRQSSITLNLKDIDCIITDPPYYDAIGYSVLMDFYYVWLRRMLSGFSADFDESFKNQLAPKWDHVENDGELIDDASRHGGDKNKSRENYENGMAKVFLRCFEMLSANGRMVVVFAHKHPDAWATLVTAIMRAGFVVDGSWPIQTERAARTRSLSSAALSSSVWLVCKKRPSTARPGWDNLVLDEMRSNIASRLRDFWDAGIRGPDFVWAATGPALEAYSKHPVVKKADEPGTVMAVSEFLNHVRKIVVDFVVGRVLTGGNSDNDDIASGDRLDDTTAYYLLHRHDFGMEDAPAGSCILYAVSCGLSDKELADTWDIISFSKGASSGSDDDDDETTEETGEESTDSAAEESSGSKVKLKAWNQRKGKSLGYEAPGGKQVPLIDRVHRLMQLWQAGDVQKVDEYLDDNALRRQELFRRFIQSLIELSAAGSEERSLLESLSNHIGTKGAVKQSIVTELEL